MSTLNHTSKQAGFAASIPLHWYKTAQLHSYDCYFKSISGLSMWKGLMRCPCSTTGVCSSWVSTRIRILLWSGRGWGRDRGISPFCGEGVSVGGDDVYGTYILTISGLGAWGVPRGVEWAERPRCMLPGWPTPDPPELAPPPLPSDALLWVSRLLSRACERVAVENTDRSAVEVILVSARDLLELLWWQSNSELASSMLGSNENLEPENKKIICFFRLLKYMTQYKCAGSQPGHHTSALYKEGESNDNLMIMNSNFLH